MMAYIDRNKFLKECAKTFGNPSLTIKAIEGCADKCTADVVEVVRCEKCKHLTIHNSMDLYAFCEKTKYRFRPFQTDTRTHFCSYGERKE